MAAKKSPKLLCFCQFFLLKILSQSITRRDNYIIAPSIHYAYKTMSSKNLLVHLYPTQGEAHSITREGGVFEYFYLVLYKPIDVDSGYS